MTQIFTARADRWFRLALLLIVLLTVSVYFSGNARSWLRDLLAARAAPDQPVPFSHLHHVGEIGIDCRYCHLHVEVGPYAGLPSMDTCMSCHFPVAPRPDVAHAIRWRRVASLPDYTYFDHSIHVQKGVGCSTCHGRVDRMSRVYQAEAFTMVWCLDCHRNPASYLRPRELVWDMQWQPPEDQAQIGTRLVQAYGIDVGNLTHCYVCHR